MKCKKNEKDKCDINCEYWQIRLKEPNKYMCLTVPHSLYGFDTILTDIEKNKELFKKLFK